MSHQAFSSGFWWREERIAQEEVGPTSILQHMFHSEHISAMAEGIFRGRQWENVRQPFPRLRADAQ